MEKWLLVSSMLVSFGCATNSVSPKTRVVLDNSNRGGSLPEWATSSKVSWDEGNLFMFKASFTVNGNQRVNGCYDLARFEVKEKLLSEIKEDIKGEINLASEGISDGVDPLLTKSMSSTINGNIKALRFQDEAFERYLVNDVERVDCFVKARLEKSEYLKLRQAVLNNLISVSPGVADAIRKKQKKFFDESDEKIAKKMDGEARE